LPLHLNLPELALKNVSSHTRGANLGRRTEVKGGGAMSSDQDEEPEWSGPDKWQVALGVLSLLVALAALAGQLAQSF
jgi:hypothetical protein